MTPGGETLHRDHLINDCVIGVIQTALFERTIFDHVEQDIERRRTMTTMLMTVLVVLVMMMMIIVMMTVI